MRKFTRRQVLTGLLGGVVGAGTYSITGGHSIQVERKTIHLPNWDADGFKIAFLSDFHIYGKRRLERATTATRLALQEKPDFIAFGGDLIDVDCDYKIDILDDALADIYDSKIPSAVIMGNHERDYRNPLAPYDYFKKCPLQLLTNETTDFHGITILGMDDPMCGYAKYSALNPFEFSKSTICLMHEPDYVHKIPYPDKISLQISGHSHGGQICLPGGKPLFSTPGARKYLAGYYPNAPVPLYVSRGIGTTWYDLRTFCPPEVSILTLKGANS